MAAGGLTSGIQVGAAAGDDCGDRFAGSDLGRGHGQFSGAVVQNTLLVCNVCEKLCHYLSPPLAFNISISLSIDLFHAAFQDFGTLTHFGCKVIQALDLGAGGTDGCRRKRPRSPAPWVGISTEATLRIPRMPT
jgi:hypothetical protein